MPLTEAEELELLELEEQEAQSQGKEAAAPVGPPEPEKPWFEAGPLKIQKSPLDVDWFHAAGNEVTKEMDPSARAGTSNPFLQMAGGEAAAGLVSKGVGAVKPLVEKFATSPLPSKIAEATNVVGKGKGLAQKIVTGLGDDLSPTAKKVFDAVSGVAGRKAAYSNPITAIPQGISDTARAVEGGQRTAAWLLDNAPHILGKFEPMLRQARQNGPAALATFNFLLQSKNPEYQSLLKEQSAQ